MNRLPLFVRLMIGLVLTMCVAGIIVLGAIAWWCRAMLKEGHTTQLVRIRQ